MTRRSAIEAIRLLNTLPHAEHEEFYNLANAHGSMEYSVEMFFCALRLFDESTTRRNANLNRPPPELDCEFPGMYGRWQTIAARDGAISIYRVGRALEFIVRSARALKSVSQDVDISKLKLENTRFREAFPDSVVIRDSVSHGVELASNREKRRESMCFVAVEGLGWNSSGYNVSDRLDGRRFGCTRKGRYCTYDLSNKSAEILVSIQDGVNAGLGAIEPAVRELKYL